MADPVPADSEGTPVVERILQVAVFLALVALLPVLLPILLVFRIYRTVLKNVIRNRLGDDNVLMVSGSDSVWLQDSPQNRAVINSLMFLEGDLDIERYRTIIQDRLALVPDPKNPRKKLMPKITSYAAKILHRYVWLPEPHFDIAEHVYVHPEPCPSDQTGLERMVSDLCSTPLPLHKAGWQFIIINLRQDHPDYGKRHYCVFRVHHSIADGISLVRIFLKLLVDQLPADKSSTAEQTKRFGSKNFLKMAVRAVFEGPALMLARPVRPSDTSVLHGPPLSGTKVFSWSEPVDLELVKRIKNATNTTVNDVVMSCLASTYRGYFKRHASVIPENVRSYVPVDIRSASADITLDNQFALVFLDLPLDESDPVTTLRKTKARMDRVKASPEPVVNALAIAYAMNRLPNWLTEAFFNWVACKSSLVLSNVPGPTQKLSVGGNQLNTLIFWPPQRVNVGMGVSIFSYCGGVRIGICTDTNIMSNPRILVDGFVEQLKLLAATLKVE